MKSKFPRDWSTEQIEQVIAPISLERIQSGKVRKISFKKGISTLPKVDSTAPDFRGFDFTFTDHSLSGNKENIQLIFPDAKEIKFADSFFGNSQISNSIFSNCDFSGIHSRSVIFSKNSMFKDCLFNGSKFVNSGLGIKSSFQNCNFDHLNCRGSDFHFGRGTYSNCIFSGQFPEVQFGDSVFKNCIFSGHFKSIGLYGDPIEKRGLLSRKISYRGPQFINCNLEGVIADEFIITPGTHLTKTQLPEYLSKIDDEIPEMGGGYCYGCSFSSDGYLR